MEDKKKEVKEWYNGYTFGNNQSMYNPWSVLKFLKEGKTDAFWANTSDNGLVKKYVREMDDYGKMLIEDLIRDKEIEAVIDNQMVYSDLDLKGSVDRILSLFLISGYLKVVYKSENNKYGLSIPNKEVKQIFEKTVREWFEESSSKRDYFEFIKSIESCDFKMMQYLLSKITKETFSHFGVSSKHSESFYHAFFLGLLISLRDRYIIGSNRESGYGRYDVMLEPKVKAKTGFIIEFKAFNEAFHENVEQVAKEALEQIEAKQYEVELKKRGIEKIVKMGIVFKGKEVRIVV
jgi:PD-(D/E)XK nuclease superfamily/Predicted AAA-ATPase